MNPNEKTEDEIAKEIERVFGSPTTEAIEAAKTASADDTTPEPINPPQFAAFDVGAFDGMPWGDDR